MTLGFSEPPTTDSARTSVDASPDVAGTNLESDEAACLN